MTELASYIETIARRLLGEPNRKSFPCRDEWRYGTHGSLVIQMTGEKQGEWYDHENQVGGGSFAFIKTYARVDDKGARKWIADELGIKDDPSPKGNICYNYVSEHGILLFQVVRVSATAKRAKFFFQRQPDGQGDWKRKLKDGKMKLTMDDVRWVPYHLDRLVAAKQKANGHPPRVYICEGEKDADRVATGELLTTTNPGGAGKWRSEYNQYFAGFDVVILPDNDEAGRTHAQHVAANLAPVAHAVRILELPGLPPKGDVTDWIHAAKRTNEDLEALVEQTPPWTPSTDPPSPLEETPQEEALRRLNDRYFVLSEAGCAFRSIVITDSVRT
jgi:putative DNA primase/helicase